MAGEALDHRRARILVGSDDPREVLRVEALAERRRLHQVAEHHGELPSLPGLRGPAVWLQRVTSFATMLARRPGLEACAALPTESRAG